MKKNNPTAPHGRLDDQPRHRRHRHLVNPGDNDKDWAKLSARERDRILQSMSEGFPPEYRTVLERYYRRLAEEKAAPTARRRRPAAKDEGRRTAGRGQALIGASRARVGRHAGGRAAASTAAGARLEATSHAPRSTRCTAGSLLIARSRSAASASTPGRSTPRPRPGDARRRGLRREEDAQAGGRRPAHHARAAARPRPAGRRPSSCRIGGDFTITADVSSASSPSPPRRTARHRPGDRHQDLDQPDADVRPPHEPSGRTSTARSTRRLSNPTQMHSR